jgi:DNA topoisomerase-1
MKLVIVESPSKASTIKKYLGEGYIVKASKGHVIDLPKSGLGVDVENNFKPEYIVTKKDSLAELKKAYKGADKLILAVDLDREGEAIGWHIAKELGAITDDGKPKKGKNIERIVFSEITKDAIQQAINSPREIDVNLVNAQQARRVLDRLVGYKLSPLLWKKISFGLSAGRVQSVALRLICEREDERDAFKSEEYWSVDSYTDLKKGETKVQYVVKKDEEQADDSEGGDTHLEDQEKKDLLKFSLFKVSNKDPEIKNKEDAQKIIEFVEPKDWIISANEKNRSKRSTKPPFITSTFQQAAVNILGFSAKRAMSIAQKLYEAGQITYMRTDSVYMGEGAVKQGEAYILKEFGKQYLPEKRNFFKSSNKAAQEAHECIRPTDLTKSGDSLGLDAEAKRVYDLIRNRALASLMAPAEIEGLVIDVIIGEYKFRANGKRIIFPGYLRVMKEKLGEVELPDLQVGDRVYPREILGIQHFTQPPGRYSEATLIKKMEELGIGRPSTYASIISTLMDRRYAENVSRYLVPTDVGRLVNKLLTMYFLDIVDYAFTAQMEDKLDTIAEGKLDWTKMLKEFYFPFEAEIIKQDKNIDRNLFKQLGTSEEKCPECGKPMVVKLGKYGKFLSCSDYPTCKGIKALEESVQDLKLDPEKFEPAPVTEDNRAFELKKSRFGTFWAHPDYPKVKDARPLLLKEKCPECGSATVERKGKFGRTFVGCSNYPTCKYIKGAKFKAKDSEEPAVAVKSAGKKAKAATKKAKPRSKKK